MRLGIGTYAFTWAIGLPGREPTKPMSPADLLDAASQLGIRVVQICDNLPLERLSSVELDRLQDQGRDLGIAFELGTRGLDPDRLRFQLGLCQRYASPFLRVVVDGPGDKPSPTETVERLKSLRNEFVSAGVRLALENHDRFTSRTLAWIVDQLGREYAGICLDTVNSFGALEGPEVVVETLSESVLCLHVKDFTIHRVSHNMGFVIEGCAAGQGRLDVPWLLQRLGRTSFPFNAILETWVTPGNSLDETIARERSWAAEGVRYLRTLIPE